MRKVENDLSLTHVVTGSVANIFNNLSMLVYIILSHFETASMALLHGGIGDGFSNFVYHNLNSAFKIAGFVEGKSRA